MSSGRERGASGGLPPDDDPALDAEPATSAVAFVLAAARGIRAPLVLIDGPSGAGKSTLADALLARWPGRKPTLVRLDDVYPGWSGLERASAMLACTLVPANRRGAVGSWRRWDWVRDRPGRRERVRPGGGGLVVEGCGAFATAGASVAAVRIWVDAGNAARRRRALDRDGGAYDPFWDLWEGQWRRHVRRTSLELLADVRLEAVRTDGEGTTGPGARLVRSPQRER
jgi:hypothetical protein